MILNVKGTKNFMDNLPKHIAIIPDGNRRWAKEKGLPTFEGHRRGFEVGIEIGKKAREIGVKVLAFWCFSTENWKRKKEEVSYLMELFYQMIEKYLQEAKKEKIRIIHLGRKDRIGSKLLAKIKEAENETKNFTDYYLAIALDYGGRDEVIRMVKRIKETKLNLEDLSEEKINQFLDTKDLPFPYPDLVIRTSGEIRTSGFMIWQTAYSEWIFYPKYFPDFTTADFEKCIEEYKKRQRRFGV